MRKLRCAALVFCLLLAVACGGTERDISYGNAEQLREAIVEAGIDCPDVDSERRNVTSTVECIDDVHAEIVNNEVHLGMKGLAPIPEDDATLTGPNWFIHGDPEALFGLEERIGGTLELP